MSPLFALSEQAAFPNRKPLSLEKTKQVMFSKPQCQEHIKETDFQEKRPEKKKPQRSPSSLKTI